MLVYSHDFEKIQAYLVSQWNCSLVYPNTPLFIAYDEYSVFLVEDEGLVVPVSFVFRQQKDKTTLLLVSSAFLYFKKETVLRSSLSITSFHPVRHQRGRKQFVSEQTTALTISYRNRSSAYGLGDTSPCHFTLGAPTRIKETCGLELETANDHCIYFVYKGLCYECALPASQKLQIMTLVSEVKALCDIVCVGCKTPYATYADYLKSSCTPTFRPDTVLVYTINMKRVSDTMFVLHDFTTE